MKHLSSSFIAAALVGLLLSSGLVLGESEPVRFGDNNPKGCEFSKSIFVNISTGDVRKTEVALRVAGANTVFADPETGNRIIGAQGHVFLAADAAILTLDQAYWPAPTNTEEYVLDEHRQCLQLGFIVRQDSTGKGPYGVTCDATVPPIGFLMEQGVQVYGCPACMADYLAEAGSALTPEQAKLKDPYGTGSPAEVQLITPENLTPFEALYDRSTKTPRCDITAAVISF